MGGGDFDGEKAVRVLNHPVRIKIIQLLGERGPLSWKELSKEVGTSTGTLYHHMDVLERLVEQDSLKRYALTKLGLAVRDYLEGHASPRNAAGLNTIIKQRSAVSSARDVLIPRSLLHSLTSSAPRAATTLVGVSATVILMLALSRSETVLLSFSPSPGLFQSAASYGGSLLALTGLGYVGSRAAHVKADPFVLLASASLAFLPLVAFSVLLRALTLTGSAGALADRSVLTLVFAVVQGWSACIASAGISVGSGLRVEKALLISLILLYVTLLVMYAQGFRFI